MGFFAPMFAILLGLNGCATGQGSDPLAGRTIHLVTTPEAVTHCRPLEAFEVRASGNEMISPMRMGSRKLRERAAQHPDADTVAVVGVNESSVPGISVAILTGWSYQCFPKEPEN